MRYFMGSPSQNFPEASQSHVLLDKPRKAVNITVDGAVTKRNTAKAAEGLTRASVAAVVRMRSLRSTQALEFAAGASVVSFFSSSAYDT